MTRNETTLSLAVRLQSWATEAHGWESGFVFSDARSRPYAYRVGPHTGYGETLDEAINNCADGCIEDGWLDDRPDEDPCSDCHCIDYCEDNPAAGGRSA